MTQCRSLPTLPLHLEFLAHFTGKWPDAACRPRWSRTPYWHLLTMVLSLVSGMATSVLLSTRLPAWWPLCIFSWMLIVHSSRKAQLVICHYAVHGTMTGRTWGDRMLVECLSTLLLIQHFEGYYHDHVRLHHSRYLATYADVDLQFLMHLGFRPGMSRRALWRHLGWTMISPRFHALFLWQRLRVNFYAAPRYRRIMAGVNAAALVGGLVLTQDWLAFLVAWVIPLCPLYHIASLLQFVSEHKWLAMYQPSPYDYGETLTMDLSPSHTHKCMLARLTFGRFVGDGLPSRTMPLGSWCWAWGRWVLRLLLLHIPTRLCVLVGDLTVHDWHHRHPHGDWANAPYARARDLAAGCPGWPAVYEEVWGLDQAIDVVFTGLAALPPLDTAPQSRGVAVGALGM